MIPISGNYKRHSVLLWKIKVKWQCTYHVFPGLVSLKIQSPNQGRTEVYQIGISHPWSIRMLNANFGQFPHKKVDNLTLLLAVFPTYRVMA